MQSSCVSLLDLVGDAKMRHAGRYAAFICQLVDGLAPIKGCDAQGHVLCPQSSVFG